MVLVALTAAPAVIWFYICPLRNRQLGLAIALRAKAENRVKQAKACFWDHNKNEGNSWIDYVNELIEHDESPLVTSDRMEFLLDAAHSELLVLRDERLLSLIFNFDELNRYLDISLNKIGSEEFARISKDRHLAYVQHLPEIAENYIGTGEELKEALTDYLKKREKGINFCGKW